jgi:ABC-2 type transport system ATP-binding protein
MLSIRQFRKSYHARTLLHIEALDWAPGAYWIQGENGAGKSTLLKCMAGVIPFQGSIRFNGFDNRKNRLPFQRLLGFAEATPVFPDMLTPDELLEFVRTVKQGKSEDQKTICLRLGLTPHLHQTLSTFSSGMLKKVSLAMALTGNPELLLLDEPYATLDTDARKELNLLLSGRLRAGAMLLFTSHQPPENTLLPIAPFRIFNQVILPA